MNPVIEKVARAICEASNPEFDDHWKYYSETWGIRCMALENFRVQARAAIEALGLTEMVESVPHGRT